MTHGAKIAGVLLLLIFGAGPGSAQWEQVNSPEGGTVRFLTIMGSMLFAGTDVGIFRSTDNCASWTEVDVGLKSRAITSLVCTGSHLVAGTNNGAFYTSDSGAHWLHSTGLQQTPWQSPILLASIGNVTFACTDKGVFRSNDYGATWGRISQFQAASRSLYSLGAKLITDGMVYSIDSGVNWLSAKFPASYPFGCFGQNGSRLFVGTLGYGIYYSDDYQNWTQTSYYSGLPNYCGIRAITAAGAFVFAGTDSGIYRSSDNGVSWSKANSGLANMRAISLQTIGNMVVAGTLDGTAYSSDLGNSWLPSSSGLRAQPFSIAASPSELLAATATGVYYSLDHGSTWQGPQLAGSISTLATCESADLASDSHDIFLSRDHGFSWSKTQPIPFANKDDGVVALAALGPNILAGTNFEFLFRSTDYGLTWISPPKYKSGVGVAALAIVGKDVIELDNGGSGFSNDSGAGWVGLGVSDVRCMVEINDSLWLAGGSNMNRTTNRGHTWNIVEGSLSCLGVNAVVRIGGAVYAGLDCGLFYSSDQGVSWRDASTVDTNAVEPNISSLFVSDGYIYASLLIGTVWRRPLSEMIGSSAVQQPAKASEASMAAYPNPFSASTKISFSATQSARTVVDIIDALGKNVSTLYDGIIEPGEHTFEWNAEGYPAGIFFCIVRTGNNTSEFPIVLNR